MYVIRLAPKVILQREGNLYTKHLAVGVVDQRLRVALPLGTVATPSPKAQLRVRQVLNLDNFCLGKQVDSTSWCDDLG